MIRTTKKKLCTLRFTCTNSDMMIGSKMSGNCKILNSDMDTKTMSAFSKCELSEST